jgi:hypothetical protein
MYKPLAVPRETLRFSYTLSLRVLRIHTINSDVFSNTELTSVNCNGLDLCEIEIEVLGVI